MEVIVNTTLGTHRYEITTNEDILDLIIELMRLRYEDNNFKFYGGGEKCTR